MTEPFAENREFLQKVYFAAYEAMSQAWESSRPPRISVESITAMARSGAEQAVTDAVSAWRKDHRRDLEVEKR